MVAYNDSNIPAQEIRTHAPRPSHYLQSFRRTDAVYEGEPVRHGPSPSRPNRNRRGYPGSKNF